MKTSLLAWASLILLSTGCSLRPDLHTQGKTPLSHDAAGTWTTIGQDLQLRPLGVAGDAHYSCRSEGVDCVDADGVFQAQSRAGVYRVRISDDLGRFIFVSVHVEDSAGPEAPDLGSVRRANFDSE